MAWAPLAVKDFSLVGMVQGSTSALVMLNEYRFWANWLAGVRFVSGLATGTFSACYHHTKNALSGTVVGAPLSPLAT